MEVANPSSLFLGERNAAAPGTAVFAGIEGTRPLLVEIQTLVAPCAFGTPRRAVVGADAGRLAMVLAVLEARCGVAFGGRDVFVNVAGGLRITEPAADLAVAAALLSCLSEEPLPPDCVVFGEVSLSGALRPVSQTEARLKEAQKLGFKRAIIPAGAKLLAEGIALDAHDSLKSLAARFGLGQSARAPARARAGGGAGGRRLRRRAAGPGGLTPEPKGFRAMVAVEKRSPGSRCLPRIQSFSRRWSYRACSP